MSGDRAYLVGVGSVPMAHPGRHRSTSRTAHMFGTGRSLFRPGRHRAGRSPLGRPDKGARLAPVPPRHDLPTGVATLLVVLAGATAVSGWFAASGAAAILGMIAH